MMDPTTIALIVTVLGSLAYGFLGWLSSGETFNWKKFTYAMISAGISGAAVYTGIPAIQLATYSTLNYVLLFLAGMGVSGAVDRGIDAINTKGTTTVTPVNSPGAFTSPAATK